MWTIQSNIAAFLHQSTVNLLLSSNMNRTTKMALTAGAAGSEAAGRYRPSRPAMVGRHGVPPNFFLNLGKPGRHDSLIQHSIPDSRPDQGDRDPELLPGPDGRRAGRFDRGPRGGLRGHQRTVRPGLESPAAKMAAEGERSASLTEETPGVRDESGGSLSLIHI